jgi:hypothetical protein
MGVLSRELPAATGLILAASVTFALRGFTVDDALITARYAAHLAAGCGYRFNIDGPVSDGVTPLPWPWMLMPFAGAGPRAALTAARAIGAAVWLLAATVLAHRLGTLAKEIGWRAWLSLLVGCTVPAVCAWSVSGMETPVATALCIFAVLLPARGPSAWLGTALAGASASFRPELLPWALVLALGRASCGEPSSTPAALHLRPRQTAAHVVVALAPFATVAVMRLIAFGSVAPLAVRAKPSDLDHGIVYALATVLMTGPPLAVLAPVAVRRLAHWPRVVLAAFVTHVIAVAAVGGDWMPLARLMVPVLASLALVFAHLAAVSATWATCARAALCVAVQVFVAARVGPAAATVLENRDELMHKLSEHLRPTDVVATLDIGWVGASFTGKVVDLAGVTDRDIAALPGGHTSKRLPVELLDQRYVSRLVLLLPSGPDAENAWRQCTFTRRIEVQLCRDSWVREHFETYTTIEATPSLRYALLSRKAVSAAATR